MSDFKYAVMLGWHFSSKAKTASGSEKHVGISIASVPKKKKTAGRRPFGLSRFTSERDEGRDGGEVHQRVVVGVEAVVQPDEALGRALGHAVVAGHQEVDAAPEAGADQL